MIRKCRVLVCVALALASAGVLAQGAASYPSKSIRLILPYPPGGGSDIIARPLVQRLSETLKQQVIVDNRGGAGGNIGIEIAAKSPADGYTIVLALTAQLAVNPSLYQKLPYDPVKDYEPITLLATGPYILVVHPSLPVKTVKDLIALARAKPNALTYASSGSGSGGHLANELLNSMAKVKMLHVPYKGGGPSVTALTGGEVSVGFATMPSVLGQIRAGRLRAIAMTTAQRSAALPGLTTVQDAGIASFDVGSWYGLSVPTGTSKDIISRLYAETLKLLALPDVKERLANGGFEIVTSTPEQYGEFVRTEVERWAKVVKLSGAKAE